MSKIDQRIWAKWQQRGIVKPKRSWRDLSREIDRMMAELRQLRPDFHGQMVHFAVEEFVYGGEKQWLCMRGYWLADGLMMTEAGTQVRQYEAASVHLPKDCPNK